MVYKAMRYGDGCVSVDNLALFTKRFGYFLFSLFLNISSLRKNLHFRNHHITSHQNSRQNAERPSHLCRYPPQ